MHTKVKLMKKVETKQVPTYKYVVEDLCEACRAPGAAAGARAAIQPPALAGATALHHDAQ